LTPALTIQPRNPESPRPTPALRTTGSVWVAYISWAGDRAALLGGSGSVRRSPACTPICAVLPAPCEHQSLASAGSLSRRSPHTVQPRPKPALSLQNLPRSRQINSFSGFKSLSISSVSLRASRACTSCSLSRARQRHPSRKTCSQDGAPGNDCSVLKEYFVPERNDMRRYCKEKSGHSG
jgi:hypothetical protein